MTGWPLLLSLLPEPHAVGNYSHTPKFRPWANGRDRPVPNDEYWAFVRVVFELCLEQVSTDEALWPAFADKLDDLPASYRDEALAQLGDAELRSDIRAELWQVLERMWRRHSEFADSDWSMSESEIEKVRAVANLLQPSNPILRHAWLFNDDMPDLGIDRVTDDYYRELDDLRIAAISDIWNEGEISSVFTLAHRAKSPWSVGYALASSELEVDPLELARLLDTDDHPTRQMSTAFLTQHLRSDNERLLRIVQTLEGQPLAQARLLAILDDLPTAWAIAGHLGDEVEAAYWREFYPYGRGADFPLANEVARQLSAHSRPAMALDVLSHFRKGPVAIDATLVIQLFGQLISAPDPEMHVLSAYEINGLMDFLRTSPSVDEEDLARLEWQLLPALNADPTSSTLQRRLARSPEFFLELLALIYRGANEEPSDTDESRRNAASNAWRLLRAWKVIPGTDRDSGRIDPSALIAWVERARILAKQVDRTEVCELQIGQVLAQAPQDTGTWPPEAVRDLLEEHGSEAMLRGFSTGAYNRRGVTTRGLTDGGRQEYELAKRYRSWAEEIKISAPKTARVLRALADGYDAEGRQNDEEAQRIQEGFGL